MLTQAARDPLAAEAGEGREADPGQAWRWDARYRDVVRLLARTAGSTWLEGWGGVPESLARLIGDDRELAGHMVQDPDLHVRRLTVLALAAVHGPWALELLTAAMEDAVPEIRALAAESADRWHACHRAGDRPPPAVVERVLSLLEDPSEEVRLSVVGPVVRLGGEAGVRRLVQAYPDADELMRGEILGALASAGHTETLARLAGSAGDQEPTPYLRRILLRLSVAPSRDSPCAAEGPAAGGE